MPEQKLGNALPDSERRDIRHLLYRNYTQREAEAFLHYEREVGDVSTTRSYSISTWCFTSHQRESISRCA